MGSVATRDAWNFTIEEGDAEFLAYLLANHPGFRANNVKKAVIQRALTRLGMRLWLADPSIDLSSVLPPPVPGTGHTLALEDTPFLGRLAAEMRALSSVESAAAPPTKKKR